MKTAFPLLLALSLPLFLLSVVPVARAQYFTGPIATATGGAGRAAADPAESSFLNPASLGHLSDFYFSGVNFVTGEHPRDGESEQFGFILSDGTKSQFVPGAFSYLRRKLKTPAGAKSTEEEFRMAIGGGVFDRITLGAGGHYRVTDNVGGPDYFQTNFDLGALYTPVSWFGLGLVAYNVLPGEDKVPVGTRNAHSVALGLHAIYESSFRGRLDFVRPTQLNSNERTDIQAGIESVFGSGFAFRAGCNWKESENKTLLGLGLGYKGPRLHADYTYEKDTRTERASRHLIDLWLPF
jgi:hypothetical protein